MTVERFEGILESLRVLYGAIAEYLNIGERRATIAYTDSGTTFTIGLQGVAEVIQAIGKVFQDAWRGVRFRKNEKVERDWDTVREGLRVVGDIRGRVARGELDTETGTRLEHLIKSQAVQLLEKGVLPATVEAVEEYDRHEVLAAVRKTPLLGPGTQPGDDAGIVAS